MQRCKTVLVAIVALSLQAIAVAQKNAPGAHPCARASSAASAAKLTDVPDKGFPTSAAWQCAKPVSFCSDWQGKNADPARATEVRLL